MACIGQLMVQSTCQTVQTQQTGPVTSPKNGRRVSDLSPPPPESSCTANARPHAHSAPCCALPAGTLAAATQGAPQGAPEHKQSGGLGALHCDPPQRYPHPTKSRRRAAPLLGPRLPKSLCVSSFLPVTPTRSTKRFSFIIRCCTHALFVHLQSQRYSGTDS